MDIIEHIKNNVNPTDFISAVLLNGASIQEAHEIATAFILNKSDVIQSKIETIINKYDDKQEAALKIFRVFPPFIINNIEETIEEDDNHLDMIKITISQKVSSIYFQKNVLRVINPDLIPSFYDDKGRYSVYVKYSVKEDGLFICFVDKEKVSARDGIHYKLGATPQADGTMSGAVSKSIKNHATAGFYRISSTIIKSDDEIWYKLEIQ